MTTPKKLEQLIFSAREQSAAETDITIFSSRTRLTHMNQSNDLARRLEDLCFEIFVLKTMLKGRDGRDWRKAFQNNLRSSVTVNHFRGKIDSQTLESLGTLLEQIDEDVDNQP